MCAAPVSKIASRQTHYYIHTESVKEIIIKYSSLEEYCNNINSNRSYNRLTIKKGFIAFFLKSIYRYIEFFIFLKYQYKESIKRTIIHVLWA